VGNGARPSATVIRSGSVRTVAIGATKHYGHLGKSLEHTQNIVDKCGFGPIASHAGRKFDV
jgi:hypothetical protein